jgi:DNA invertase Pin-like site-specific DNA recombinase
MTNTMAYIRVSTDKQDVENQRLEILKLANDKGLGKVKFIEETVSGKKPWRDRLLAPTLDNLARDDALIVAELSRLGRSMLEIMEILSISTQKGIKIYASKGNWSMDGSMQSKIIAVVLAMAAEIERDLISQRTKAALATKKANGFHLGRPKGPGKSKLDEHKDDILELLDLGVTKKRIAQKMETTVGNLNHWLKKRKIATKTPRHKE